MSFRKNQEAQNNGIRQDDITKKNTSCEVLFLAFTYIIDAHIFNEISPFTTADPILLVCLLYQSYVKITKSDEPLDKFFAWGEVMLQDFNDIDNSMIPADKLFANIDELDNLTDFSFLSETQKETIKKLLYFFLLLCIM